MGVKARVLKESPGCYLAFAGVIITALVAYATLPLTALDLNSKNIGDLGGALGAIFAAITFLPQVIKTVKSGRAQDVSLLMLAFAFAGNIGWLLHGLHLESIPLIGSSVLIMFLLIPLFIVKYLNFKKEKAILASEKYYLDNNMPC